MDIFFTFLFLFLTLFAVKIYLIHKKTREGFKFHRRKHHPPPNSSSKKNENMKTNKKQTKEEEENTQENTQENKLVENMDMPDPFEEIDKIVNDFENLHDVYERNAEGYPGDLGSVNGPIPEIPEIPELHFGLPFPLDILTEPLEEIVNFFIDILNGFIDFFNIVIDLIDIVIHYATCAFTLLVNFFTVPCSFWYILNLLTTIIYLPFAFIFWLLGITDIIDDYVWGPIYIADEVLHDFSGFHFAHFPDSIIKGCYSCPAEFEIMGMSNFAWIGQMFKDAFNIFPNKY
jgi:hypothetical protein